MRKNKNIPFSRASIAQAIHKSMYDGYLSSQCEPNHLNFLKLLDEEYLFLASKRFFQNAVCSALNKAIRHKKYPTLNYLKDSKIFEQLKERRKVEFFSKALILNHKYSSLIIKLLLEKYPNLLANSKIQNAIYSRITRAAVRKNWESTRALADNNLLLFFPKGKINQILNLLYSLNENSEKNMPEDLNEKANFLLLNLLKK